MKPTRPIRHAFVEFIPGEREADILYVSMQYATAVHNCFCGCGLKVVTPLHPTAWRLMFDGQSISLSPSVGNWNFPCRSHYWIRNGNVVWAGDMTSADIKLGRMQDQAMRDQYFGNAAALGDEPVQAALPQRRF